VHGPLLSRNELTADGGRLLPNTRRRISRQWRAWTAQTWLIPAISMEIPDADVRLPQLALPGRREQSECRIRLPRRRWGSRPTWEPAQKSLFGTLLPRHNICQGSNSRGVCGRRMRCLFRPVSRAEGSPGPLVRHRRADHGPEPRAQVAARRQKESPAGSQVAGHSSSAVPTSVWR
jgi:hypothetical protein